MFNYFFKLFLISYKFSDSTAKEIAGKISTEWHNKGGPQNRLEGYPALNADSLEIVSTLERINGNYY